MPIGANTLDVGICEMGERSTRTEAHETNYVCHMALRLLVLVLRTDFRNEEIRQFLIWQDMAQLLQPWSDIVGAACWTLWGSKIKGGGGK